MALNHHFWQRVFREEFAPQLSAIVEALEKRVLPGFDGIEQEAQAHSDDVWMQLNSAPGTGDEDPSELAEAAQDAGVDRYALLDGIRQGIVNLFAASLYHAFEQQLMVFHRRELLHPTEENNLNLIALEELRVRLLAYGVDLSALSSWSAIEELRLVANTVKHAEGKSANRLHELRPDFFRKAGFPGLGEWFIRWKPRVFQPLVGKDLYVEPKDVRAYLTTLLQFWEEFWVAISEAKPPEGNTQ